MSARHARHHHQPPAVEPVWPAVDDELLKVLPAVLRAVVRALGYARARDWLVDHGGVNVSVPLHRTEALGLEPEELTRLRVALAPHLDDNGRVAMPKADKLFQVARNAQIRKDRLNAASLTTLARQHRLTSRMICNICRDADDRQADLF